VVESCDTLINSEQSAMKLSKPTQLQLCIYFTKLDRTSSPSVRKCMLVSAGIMTASENVIRRLQYFLLC